jgi:outer membrane protein
VTTLSLTLSVPLTDGGATQSLVRQALAQRDAAQQALEIQRRQVERDVQDQYRSVLADVRQIELTREAAGYAAKALAATRVGQQTGTRSMTDALVAIQVLASAQNAYSLARHQLVLDKLLLLQTAGTVSEADLSAINAQLK